VPRDAEVQKRSFELRKSLVLLRRLILPMREVVNTVLRRDLRSIDPEMLPYFQDVYDHVLRATEWTESLRDLVTTILETNISIQGNRMNMIMKKVTSWAAIIAVPTAITGFFGQNLAFAGFGTARGLWIGALAVFLVLRPVTRRALSSTAANGRLVFSALARASAITVGQALLLVGLLHLALGVSWSLLPATLGFSILTALAFTAFHYLLTIGLGKAGLVVSLFVLAIQVTSTGGLYPIQLLAAPFQWISPLLPLTYGVQGMQGIIAGGDPGVVIGAAATLLAFGIGSVLVALLAIRRTRRTQDLLLAAHGSALSRA
jgi:YhgE/Pip-like protein